jgi:hypothetical protein
MPPDDDWAPFNNQLEFELVDFLYSRNQMPAQQIDTLLDIWGDSLCRAGGQPLFKNHKDLYKTIDVIQEGDIKWQCFSLQYTHQPENEDHVAWMEATYDVWYRCPRQMVHNLMGNPELADKMDFRPYREYDSRNNERRFQNFMGGDWAWDQADIIYHEHADNDGAMFVPIVLGSNKTTVSVATGQHDYYSLYLSISNLHNSARRSHRHGVALIAFLAIPKTTRKEAKTAQYRKFRRRLFHVSLSCIIHSLEPHMTQWEVVRCSDRHYRRVVYGLGPYIADYEEQALLACIVRNWCARCLGHRLNLDEPEGRLLLRTRDHIDDLIESFDFDELWSDFGIVADIVPFTNDFPRADICQLLSPDMLHQLIKGVFKDHLVDWVGKYLVITYGQKRADEILDDIDRRIASVASFAGLRRFPQGRHFKQWTGDDSKALMKVYLAAIEGYGPGTCYAPCVHFLSSVIWSGRISSLPQTLSNLRSCCLNSIAIARSSWILAPHSPSLFHGNIRLLTILN